MQSSCACLNQASVVLFEASYYRVTPAVCYVSPLAEIYKHENSLDVKSVIERLKTDLVWSCLICYISSLTIGLVGTFSKFKVFCSRTTSVIWVDVLLDVFGTLLFREPSLPVLQGFRGPSRRSEAPPTTGLSPSVMGKASASQWDSPQVGSSSS